MMNGNLLSNATAFILAGGKSTRMGADKAFLRLGRITLLEHVISLAKEACDRVVLVGDRGRLRPFGWVVEDTFPGQGPLAGIHAALSSPSANELNLFLAVDLPNLAVPLLKYLLKVADQSREVVTVPYTNGIAQTLCAVYRKEFAAVAEEALKAGQNKIDSLYADVSTRMIAESELAKVGFVPGVFDNINTKEDWDRIQGRLGAAQGS
jgi:molybdopterin-guanine dinucleotide biosynthesis protein A